MARSGAFACFALCCLSGCDGTVVNLGNSEPLVSGGDSGSAGSAIAGSGPHSGSGGGPEWIRSDEPVLPTQPNFGFANPVFPESGAYMLFTRQERGAPDAHIWRADRAGDGFALPDFENGSPLDLGEGTEYGASSPGLSASGEELWFSKYTADYQSDVYVALAAGGEWGTPVLVPELQSAEDDAPRSPALGGTLMPLSSKRHGDPFFQIYFVERDAVGGVWGEPNRTHLENVNVAGTTSVDGFLTEDGLTLYFAAARVEPFLADLFRARRSSIDESFGTPEPLTELNTGSDERDPWLTPDGAWLYYSSNRTGLHAIYRARRNVP